jgi:chromate transporter
MSGGDLLALFLHFLGLSVFATGGALSLASDMHRYVVDERGYLTHTQFVDSIALAQAAPGPNVLFVTIMGWQIAHLPGAIVTTVGLSLPSLVFPVLVSRISRMAQFDRVLKALKRGLGPVALGLMAATSYLLMRQLPGSWLGLCVAALTMLLMLATRLPALAPILLAGVMGAALGW